MTKEKMRERILKEFIEDGKVDLGELGTIYPSFEKLFIEGFEDEDLIEIRCLWKPLDNNPKQEKRPAVLSFTWERFLLWENWDIEEVEK
ncbi:hypothetical protein J7L85_00565 [candidate division WOR-3 bacterium]|nr:hypothetical protein [candidate division WOR-3 bacterium]